MKSDQFFYELTPDRVMNALEESGFELSGHYQILNSLENRVFDFRLESGSHIVAKFYRPGRWSEEQILEEHSFTAHLLENEIPVLNPLTLKNGRTTGRTPPESGSVLYAVWERTGGRIPEDLRDEELVILGRYIARIHNAASGFEFHHRPVLNAVSVLNHFKSIEKAGLIPDSVRNRYYDICVWLSGEYAERSRLVKLHPIHGDCHKGNLLHHPEGGFFFLDFDDCQTGPAAQDIWLLLPGRDTETLRQREVLLSGYRQLREFGPEQEALTDLLRAMRYIQYSAWIARRWEDPLFQDTFPHFSGEDYWESELRDLERECSGVIQESGSLEHHPAAGQPEEELTNKDFFWDWEDQRE